MERALHQGLHCGQKQVMGLALRRSLTILQIPRAELIEMIDLQAEQNPLIEVGESCVYKKSRTIDIAELSSSPTLREHLLAQLWGVCLGAEDFAIAQQMIELIDDRGWIGESPEEASMDPEAFRRILLIVQSFNPPGIGGRNLQEVFWLQARAYHSCPLVQTVIRDHFDDLIHGRLIRIQKQLQISSAQMNQVLHDLGRFHMHPAAQYCPDYNPQLIPDLILKERDSEWILDVWGEETPLVVLRKDFMQLLPHLEQREEKKQLRQWISEAKTLMCAVQRRQEILKKTGVFLMREQGSFFTQGRAIIPIPLKKLAHFLNIHPSTAWRAVAGKNIACPQGIFPLAKFFSESTATDPVKELIRQLVNAESKELPMSDLQIMKELCAKGFCCARRTVAKYRSSLKIASANRRRMVSQQKL